MREKVSDIVKSILLCNFKFHTMYSFYGFEPLGYKKQLSPFMLFAYLFSSNVSLWILAKKVFEKGNKKIKNILRM